MGGNNGREKKAQKGAPVRNGLCACPKYKYNIMGENNGAKKGHPQGAPVRDYNGIK